MTETTTEQLAEIEGQQADTPVTEYTPPEGWRVLEVGEVLRDGDLWVKHEGELWPTKRVGETVNDDRYIRQIASEPDCQTEEIQYLRREISTLQNQLGESQRRVTQLEELVASLRTINEAQEKAVRLAGQENTDLQHRLSVVADQWALQAGEISGLQTQLDAVKAEVVQERLERNRWHNQVLRLTAELDEKTTECRNLQIELDALQQAPQAEAVAVVPTSTDGRFEEGWDAGSAWAVETIAEWLEPIKGAIDAADNVAETERAGNLAADIIRALPAIMRSLTGLADED